MDFESVHPFNALVNKISGNLLPMTEKPSLSIFWQLYGVWSWLMQVIIMSILIPGCIIVPMEKTLKDGLVGIAVTTEVVFVYMRIYMQRELVQRLIRQLNKILSLDDEMMRNIVTSTLKAKEIPLKFYWTAGLISIIVWSTATFTLVFEKKSFTYVDYRMPIAFGKEPISIGTYITGSLIILISGMFIFTKKVAVDTYTIHLTLLIASQYKYIASKLSEIFRDNGSRNDPNDSVRKENHSKNNRSVEEQIKAVCRHHNLTVHATFMLKQLLAVIFSFLYMNSVLRFCFIGIMVMAIPSTDPLEGSLFVMYTCGAIVQLYILCSGVQQLLDVTVEITDQAFHEEWYLQKPSVKRTFMSIIMANNLGCKFAIFDQFNLSLPSFISILNSAYTVAILLSKVS